MRDKFLNKMHACGVKAEYTTLHVYLKNYLYLKQRNNSVKKILSFYGKVVMNEFL